MSGTYLLRIPGQGAARSELLSAAVTKGISTYHLHLEFQFATSAMPSVVSIGAHRRIRVSPGQVVLISPGTVHAETATCGANWRLLHLPPAVVDQLCPTRPGIRVIGQRLGATVLTDPALAEALIGLVEAAGLECNDRFLDRAARWIRALVSTFSQEVELPPQQYQAQFHPAHPGRRPSEWRKDSDSSCELREIVSVGVGA